MSDAADRWVDSCHFLHVYRLNNPQVLMTLISLVTLSTCSKFPVMIWTVHAHIFILPDIDCSCMYRCQTWRPWLSQMFWFDLGLRPPNQPSDVLWIDIFWSLPVMTSVIYSFADVCMVCESGSMAQRFRCLWIEFSYWFLVHHRIYTNDWLIDWVIFRNDINVLETCLTIYVLQDFRQFFFFIIIIEVNGWYIFVK